MLEKGATGFNEGRCDALTDSLCNQYINLRPYKSLPQAPRLNCNVELTFHQICIQVSEYNNIAISIL